MIGVCVYFGIISWYLFTIIKFPKALIWSHQESTWFSHNRNAWKTWRKGMEMCVPQSQNHDDESMMKAKTSASGANSGKDFLQRVGNQPVAISYHLHQLAPAMRTARSHVECLGDPLRRGSFFCKLCFFKLYWQSNLYSKAFWQQGSTLTIKKLETSSQKSKSGDMCILKSDITKYVHVPLIIFVWFKKNILLMATRNPA